MFPQRLDVIIEGMDSEQKSNKIRDIPWEVTDPVAEYETDTGLKFCISLSYVAQCREEKRPPHIPMQVITKNAEIKEKLEFGNERLNKQARESESGLVLPDGYRV